MAKRKPNRTFKILTGIVLALALLIFIAAKAGWIGKKDLTEVEVAQAGKRDITEKVSASGKVQPEVEVKISPDVSGEIIDLFVAEGDSVQQGKLLLRIRPDNYESLHERAKAAVNTSKANLAQAKASTAQAEARLLRAKTDFERNKSLFDQKVIAEQDFEISKSNYDVARAELEAARQNVQASVYNVQSSEASLREASENLRKTEIYAPVSGTISKLNVEKGERVVGTSQMAGTEILRIANLNNMEVRVDVNENDIVRVQLGDTADIEIDSYSNINKKFKGIVTSIANTAKEAATTDAITEFQVKVRILNDSYADLSENGQAHPFRPGMTASVDIITDHKDNVLAVPLSAVTTRIPGERIGRNPGEEDESPDNNEATTVANNRGPAVPKAAPKEVVFVLDSGKVKMIEVQTGISDFENIEILSGLQPGQQVVSGPYTTVSRKLSAGDMVRIKEKEETAEVRR
jgi:HlyD family secretion protein